MKGEGSTWTYRIALMPKAPRAEQSQVFLDSMRERGAEVVDTHASWVYLRRPAPRGPFEIFPDVDARISHHLRVATMYSSVTAALIPLVAVAGSTSLLRASGQWVAPVLLVEIVLLVTMAWAGAQHHLRAAKLRTQSKPTR